MAFVFFLFGIFQSFFSLSKILFSGILFDFGYFLRAAGNLSLGINPYFAENFVYPLPVVLLYLPLLRIPLYTSQIIWFFLSLIALLTAIYFSLKSIDWQPKTKHLLIIFPLIFLSFPVKWSFGLGQINFLVLLCLVFCFFFSQKKQDLPAGISLGLSIILKLSPLFFVLYFLIKKRFKIVFFSLVTVVVLFSLSGMLFGFNLIKDYFLIVLPKLFEATSKHGYYNQAFSSLSAGFFKDKNILTFLNFFFAAGITLADSYVFLKTKGVTAWDYSLGLCSILLINGFSWQHHFVLLIFVFLVIAHNFIFNSTKKIKWSFFFACYLLISFNFKKPDLLGEGVFAKILQAHVFWGDLLLWLFLFFTKKTKTE